MSRIPGLPPFLVCASTFACLFLPVATRAADQDATMPYLKPAALKPGDTIAFIAPAGPAEEAPFLAYKAQLEKAGYKIVVAENLGHRKQAFLGGTDDERANELNAMLHNPMVRAIFPVRGGYGLTPHS